MPTLLVPLSLPLPCPLPLLLPLPFSSPPTTPHYTTPYPKNIGDSSLGAIAWWLFGHALAFGADSRGFVGTSGFALKGEDLYGTDSGIINVEGYTTWIFEWAFAATSATIVSGAMAERATFGAYVMHSFIITSFICEFFFAVRAVSCREGFEVRDVPVCAWSGLYCSCLANASVSAMVVVAFFCRP